MSFRYIGTEPWIRVYQSSVSMKKSQAIAIFCGLIPHDRFVQEVLSSHEWDIHIGDFAPCLIEDR